MSLIRFCQECNNMLYPVEDRSKQILTFVCRRSECNYVREMDREVAEENIVSKNNVHNNITEDLKNEPGVVDTRYAFAVEDPSLGRAKDFECSSGCTSTEAVFFQLPERMSEKAMKIILVCLKCKNWKYAESK